MPCFDENNYGMPCERSQFDDALIEELRKHNDELVRMLCGICGRVEYSADYRNDEFIPHTYDGPYEEEVMSLINHDDKLKVWWERHKAFDIERAE